MEHTHYSTLGISVYGQLTLAHSSSNVCWRQAPITSGDWLHKHLLFVT